MWVFQDLLDYRGQMAIQDAMGNLDSLDQMGHLGHQDNLEIQAPTENQEHLVNQALRANEVFVRSIAPSTEVSSSKTVHGDEQEEIYYCTIDQIASGAFISKWPNKGTLRLCCVRCSML